MMRRALVLVAVLLLAGACGTGPGPASPPGSSDAVGSPGPSAVPASPRPTDAPTDPPAAAPTEPPPSEEPEPDPASFLQVCRGFDGPRDEPPIPCEDAVETALTAESVTSPTRVEVRFGCGPAPSCTGPHPDRAFVTVVAGGTATEVEVARGADGAIEAVAARPGAVPPPPAFTPPAAGRASLPGGAPPSLATRPPYPLCGQEEAPVGGPYDETARRCFLTAVLAGSPVEFASMGAGTEGQRYMVLYRSSGTGGVEVVTGEAGQWLRTFTGIGEAPGGLVFDVDGMSTRREPVP